MKKVLVTGASGFIGHHLVKYLIDKDYWARGIDIKDAEFEASPANEFKLLDLRERESCREAVEGISLKFIISLQTWAVLALSKILRQSLPTQRLDKYAYA